MATPDDAADVAPGEARDEAPSSRAARWAARSWSRLPRRVRTGLFVVAVLLAGAYAQDAFGNGAGTALVFAAVSARNAALSARRRRNRRALNDLLAQLRALGADARHEALAEIEPVRLRTYLSDALARDGSDERAGDVERFPFSRERRRRATRDYWGAWGAAAIALLAAALTDVGTAVRSALVGTGLAASAAAWWTSRRQRRLATVIEVTPFRLTEEGPDGLRRTVLFNRYLELENQEKRRRVVLRPGASGAGADGISLDYDRIGFHRLMELVVRHGGFKVADEESAAG